MPMTISGSSGLTFPDSTTQSSGSQACKAWLKYNLSTQTVNASYNVSSVTYLGTGSFTVNFTSAFTDTNYSIVGSTSQLSAGAGMGVIGQNLDSPSITTTSVKLYALGSSSNSLANFPNISIAFFR